MKIKSCILLIILFACACKSDDKNQKKLGQLELVVTGNEQAQKYFKEGLLYLHSFEYLDARASFIKAQQADQLCGMAYWGEVMAYNHPLFNRELTRLANIAFSKMGASKEARQRLFKTEMEKDLLKSIELLFGTGSKAQRDKSYRLHLEKLTKKYKGNHEIEAFYALALLASPISQKTENLFEHSAKISEKILSENPEHPGALHYLIHANDHPSRAEFAIDAADKYSVIAPDATHALHMPSHIYFALGRWNNVVNSNINSWNAGVKARVKQPNKEIGYHSLSWLHYGLLQRGENQLATTLVKNMMQYDNIDQSGLARSYNVVMKGIHMVETNTWKGEVADWSFKIDDLHLTKKSGYNFLEGMKAYHLRDKQTLKSILKKIGKDKYTASLNLGDAATATCNTAGNPSIPPNQMDLDLVSIMEYELQSYLFKMEGNNANRLEVLSKGVELYEKLKMASGPPVIFKPVHELYAEALMENNQHKDAFNIIEKALDNAPKTRSLLLIKKEIAKMTNKPQVVKEINLIIEEISSLQEREEVLTFNI